MYPFLLGLLLSCNFINCSNCNPIQGAEQTPIKLGLEDGEHSERIRQLSDRLDESPLFSVLSKNANRLFSGSETKTFKDLNLNGKIRQELHRTLQQIVDPLLDPTESPSTITPPLLPKIGRAHV